MSNQFEMQEYAQIVAKLAEHYTGKESTSISYDKARQLMGAVLYCIQEYENGRNDGNSPLAVSSAITAKEAYNLGYQAVLDKVERTRVLYNQMISTFESYGNQSCEETFIKGIPAFLKYYDARFHPQEHILTLDYPILVSLEKLCGVDIIYEYVKCIQLEQVFLSRFPQNWIHHILSTVYNGYEELFINMAGVILRNVLGCMVAGKVLMDKGYSLEEVAKIKGFVQSYQEEELEKKLIGLTQRLVNEGYGGDHALFCYLSADMHDFSYELKNAVDHDCLYAILAL